ncbi:MAG: TIGR01777 family oxidoreductase [Anaerolineaceae bacterium]|jgi:uncharacterized protein (TIGR01777 family)
MRIIIAGGTGLIGRALARELYSGGHEVLVLSRNPQTVTEITGAHLVQWDGRTPHGWGRLVDEAGAVVNLAGASIGGGRWTKARKASIEISRVEAGQAILDAINQAARHPMMVLQASAIGYYGVTGEQTITEHSPAGEDFLAQVCVAWEGATKAVADLGVRHVITRSGLVVSKKGGFMDPVLLQYRLFGGGRLGNGRQWWSWIALRDEVRALRFLIENEHASGAYNLTAPEPARMSDFGRAVASVLRRPHFLPIPAFALKLVLGEMSQLVLGSQRIVPERLLAAGFLFQFSDLKQALQAELLGSA